MDVRVPLAVLLVAVFVHASNNAGQAIVPEAEHDDKLTSQMHQLESRMQMIEEQQSKVDDDGMQKSDPIFHPNPLKMHLRPKHKHAVKTSSTKQPTVQVQTKMKTKMKTRASSRRRHRVVVVHTSRRRRYYYGGHVYVSGGSGGIIGSIIGGLFFLCICGIVLCVICQRWLFGAGAGYIEVDSPAVYADYDSDSSRGSGADIIVIDDDRGGDVVIIDDDRDRW